MINDDRRVLAVKLEPELFMEMKRQVKILGLTEQKFIRDLVFRETEKLKLSEEQNKTNDIQPKTLSKEDVEKAIEEYIIRFGRPPKQTEYKNENGLPSYGTASKCLGMSASLYGQEKAEELYESGMIDRPENTSYTNTIMNL